MSKTDGQNHNSISIPNRQNINQFILAYMLPVLVFPVAFLGTAYCLMTYSDSGNAAFKYIHSLIFQFPTFTASLILSYGVLRFAFRNVISKSKWSPILGGIAAFQLFPIVYSPVEPIVSAFLELANVPVEWKIGLVAMGIVPAATGIASECVVYRVLKAVKQLNLTGAPRPA